MANENQSRATPSAENRTQTVTIGCKMPQGLLMQIHEKVAGTEPVLGGGVRATEVWKPKRGGWVINGCSHAQNRAPAYPIIGGFGITRGVPRDFWEQWLEQHKLDDMVVNGLIFAVGGNENAEAYAKEHASAKSGMERMDPLHLPDGIEVLDEKKEEVKRAVAANAEEAAQFARKVA